MEFVLTYEGRISSNGGPAEKHRIRQHFHPQLKVLWDNEPIVSMSQFFTDEVKRKELDLVFPVAKFNFVPLVNRRLSMLGELDILFLRPEMPGNLVLQSGDIDNRLKTLLDALSIPSVSDAGDKLPQTTENPFFCLFEDDSLIKSLSVKTERLLKPNVSVKECLLTIRVRTRIFKHSFIAIPFA